jgi:chloramphenicol 3-O-phosphotransferase
MCPVEEIEKREHRRGNRYIGEGKSHIDDGIHTWSEYDCVFDTFKNTNEDNVNQIIHSIREMDGKKSAFEKRYKQMQSKNCQP